MRIAIIHHHLHPGGVTRIIESQVNSLYSLGNCELTIHTGELPQYFSVNEAVAPVFVSEFLQYLPADLSGEMMQDRFQKIVRYLDEVAGHHDILHVHNLNLGKNPLLTLAVYQLAKQGVVVINHCHDFAEDRPQNHAFLNAVIQDFFREKLSDVLYPPLSNYHYLVLTSQEHKRLSTYGVNQNRISLLPNPVTFSVNINKQLHKEMITGSLGINHALKICLYPVRAIHRKNIGEFILLSVLFRDRASWLITQAPQNPLEIPEYKRWKEFCRTYNIPVVFEAGNKIDIYDLMPAVDFCITTSIREGFGMAFMEPWLAGTPVIGRNLENRTTDMIRNGMRFSLLYDRFSVTFKGEKKDFGHLNPQQQQQIIKDVIIEPGIKEEIYALNDFLKKFLEPVKQEIITYNQLVIHEKYSPENYGKELHGIYQKLSGRA
ncbi:MAG: glycosyltransferase family 4 protein [Bacteroidales bacterium]|nr:glycosyltransferase family 4 protein [Bacteroidales bacterium]